MLAINDLGTDLADGTNLIALLEIISSKSVCFRSASVCVLWCSVQRKCPGVHVLCLCTIKVVCDACVCGVVIHCAVLCCISFRLTTIDGTRSLKSDHRYYSTHTCAQILYVLVRCVLTIAIYFFVVSRKQLICSQLFER